MFYIVALASDSDLPQALAVARKMNEPEGKQVSVSMAGDVIYSYWKDKLLYRLNIYTLNKNNEYNVEKLVNLGKKTIHKRIKSRK